MKKFLYWIVTVSRGYSAPMSVLNWLVVFVLTIKSFETANIIYGILALIAIVFAHLGTNLFDDCVDYLLKVPKQECKTEYLETGFTNIKTVFGVTILYFAIASIIGFFFFLKFGMPVIYLAMIGAIIILAYPKLNNFALGELAVGICFGVLLFAGVNFVMTGQFNANILLISIPVSLLTVGVVYAHALMDFDFDKQSGKFTFCILLRNKKNALWGLMFIYFVTFIFTIWLIVKGILPYWSIVTLAVCPLIIKLYNSLNKYISKDYNEKSEFMINFITARDVSLFYNIILIITFLFMR